MSLHSNGSPHFRTALLHPFTLAQARPPRRYAQTPSRCPTLQPAMCVKNPAKETMVKILFVLTSHDKLGDTGDATGLWYEELAAPYYLLKDAGAEIVLASPKGGPSPVDPRSRTDQFQTEYTKRFDQDSAAQATLANTRLLSNAVNESVDAVFVPGGHGPIFDLPDNPDAIALLERTYAADKPIALVCHGSSVLRHAKAPGGASIVAGKRVTGFTNSEEAAIGATETVPFLIEDELTRAGGHFVKAADWQPNSVRDGLLITGQNPASAESTAKRLLEALKDQSASQAKAW